MNHVGSPTSFGKAFDLTVLSCSGHSISHLISYWDSWQLRAYCSHALSSRSGSAPLCCDTYALQRDLLLLYLRKKTFPFLSHHVMTDVISKPDCAVSSTLVITLPLPTSVTTAVGIPILPCSGQILVPHSHLHLCVSSLAQSPLLPRSPCPRLWLLGPSTFEPAPSPPSFEAIWGPRPRKNVMDTCPL